MINDFGFSVCIVQTDWGTEFFNDAFQEELMEHYIKFRPIKPRYLTSMEKLNVYS